MYELQPEENPNQYHLGIYRPEEIAGRQLRNQSSNHDKNPSVTPDNKPWQELE